MDREQVMSWLEGLSQDDWRLFHSDSEVSNIAKDALALLKQKENDIHHMGLIIEEYEKELKEQETVKHALEVLKANGWKETRQRDIYSDETYSVIKKKA